MKMSICQSTCEHDASLQVSISVLFVTFFHATSVAHTTSNSGAQIVPEAWMTPFLASPLIDSAVLAVQSTEISAEAAKKVSVSSFSGRGVFDHSNSLVGAESELTRVCTHCASLISFQERCIIMDQVMTYLLVISFLL